MVKIFNLSIWILPLVFNLGALTQVNLPFPGVNFYLYDLLVLFFAFAGIISLKNFFSKVSKWPIIKPVLTFLTIGLVSLVINLPKIGLKNTLFSSLYLVRWASYALFGLVVYLKLKLNPKAVLNWKKSFLWSGVLFLILGAFQYYFWPSLRGLMPLGWDEHLFRFTSTFLDPNFASIWLNLLILLSMDWTYWQLPGFFLGLFLTYSRSGYLAFLITILTWSTLKKSWQTVLAAIVTLSLAIIFLPRPYGEGGNLKRTASITARSQNWKKSFKTALKRPLLGHGFNSLRFFQDSQVIESHSAGGVDSSLFFVFLTTGVVGLAAYAHLLYKMFKNSGVVFKSGLMGVLVHSFFNHSLFYPQVMFWIWIVWSLDRLKTK